MIAVSALGAIGKSVRPFLAERGRVLPPRLSGRPHEVAGFNATHCSGDTHIYLGTAACRSSSATSCQSFCHSRRSAAGSLASA
jgi:hypothetical protein